ncbi:MAG: histidinol dehydrogenase, partial [Kiritimatiellia bacterium]|nr:histidinol dehydrogenase [Kiritimatiellia bacterium]
SGDAAILRFARKFDRIRLTPEQFRLSETEIRAAEKSVSPDFKKAARQAAENIGRFARAGLRKNWEIRAPGGGRIGERYLPLQRVGLYIPGGASPLASTVLMTAILARIAGVPERVACTPCSPDGSVNPHLLYALRLAGVREVYRIGGIAAIGAMAYGTRSVRAVDKIVGPGGPYVTAAKRQVYGKVALDLVAGPSEIAIWADDTAHPQWIAEDLLSQAEHGTGRERALLSTTSTALARAVQKELSMRAAVHPRGDCVRRVIGSRTLLVVSRTSEAAADMINRFAPEHLEIITRSPRRDAQRIRHAGAIFLGRWSPESVGDFAAGPSHVLPTGGTARFFGGLTVEDFRRRTSLIEMSRAGLRHVRPVVDAFSRVEDLPSHGRSVSLRFESELSPPRAD